MSRKRKLEQKFWRSLRPHLYQIPEIEFDRIENGVGPDVPDITYSKLGTGGRLGYHGWIELKAGEIDANADIDLSHFTQGQKRWLRTRGKRGGNCWVMVRTYDGMLDPINTYLVGWHKIPTLGKGRVSVKVLEAASTKMWKGSDLEGLRYHL